MAQPKNTIQINDRVYDARTGALLTGAGLAQPLHPTNGTALDGVQRRKASSHPQNNAAPASVSLAGMAPPSRKKIPSGSRALDIKPIPKKAQRSQTLHRSVVKKPTKTPPQETAAASPVSSRVERSATGRGYLLKRVPDARIARAKQIAKSNSVSKFAHSAMQSHKITAKTVTDAPVKAPPLPESKPAPAVIKKPVFTPNQPIKKEVFNHSIANATHHALPKVAKPSFVNRIRQSIRLNPRITSAIAACLAVVVLGGFLAYQNVPSVAMRVAASQAGFNGKLPGDTPAGFAFKGPVNYQKGVITLNYRSNSDERKFVITQKPTSWNSESLLTNHLLSNKTRYQTYYDKGLTVYIYGGGNATWVSKGVWYTVTGKGSLSSEQILAIASSM